MYTRSLPTCDEVRPPFGDDASVGTVPWSDIEREDAMTNAEKLAKIRGHLEAALEALEDGDNVKALGHIVLCQEIAKTIE